MFFRLAGTTLALVNERRFHQRAEAVALGSDSRLHSAPEGRYALRRNVVVAGTAPGRFPERAMAILVSLAAATGTRAQP
jgi:hypothetical protein